MKSLLKFLVYRSRVLKLFRRDQLIIFNYHRIKYSDRSPLFDDFVFGPDIKRFEEEITWIKKETRVLTENELIDIVYNKRKMEGICSLVTFDDGYIDNYELAFPILKKHQIPAIFYIPTEAMDERKLGWWDIAAYLVKHTAKEHFEFRERQITIGSKPRLIKDIHHELKNMEASRVKNYLNDLSVALDVSLPTIELQSKELMTWDQLRNMQNEGMTIGSHTHDHYILSKQNLEEMRVQLQKSLNILEKELGKKVSSLAYPVGEYAHFDHETKNMTKELGLKLGLSYRTGINSWANIDPYDVKRVPVLRHWPNLDLPLAFPQVAYPFLKE